MKQTLLAEFVRAPKTNYFFCFKLINFVLLSFRVQVAQFVFKLDWDDDLPNKSINHFFYIIYFMNAAVD